MKILETIDLLTVLVSTLYAIVFSYSLMYKKLIRITSTQQPNTLSTKNDNTHTLPLSLSLILSSIFSGFLCVILTAKGYPSRSQCTVLQCGSEVMLAPTLQHDFPGGFYGAHIYGRAFILRHFTAHSQDKV